MSYCSLLIEREVGSAKLGSLIDQLKLFNDIDLNQGIPYVAHSEDIAVILKNQDKILQPNQMLEFNGFETRQLLNKALNEGLRNPSATYQNLSSSHPILTSFPPEVFWLSHEKGVKYFQENLSWILQKDGFKFDKTKAEKISGKIAEIIMHSKQKYQIWESLTQRYEGEVLSTILIIASIELAKQSKSKFLAGIVPIIDSKAPNSVSFCHRTNIAYSNFIEIQQSSGETPPRYLYTIPINSSMITTSWTDQLREIVQNVKAAAESKKFDGFFVAVRGLKDVSDEASRVDTLSNLMTSLNKIAYNELLPIWWSRVGFIGVATLDNGAQFFSYSMKLKLEDVYTKFISNSKKSALMRGTGKFYRFDTRELLDWYEVCKLPNKFQTINATSNVDINSFDGKPGNCRTQVQKPSNVQQMNKLVNSWVEHIKNGEMDPGQEHLQGFKDPVYRVWGAR
jgi:hypothetical protein